MHHTCIHTLKKITGYGENYGIVQCIYNKTSCPAFSLAGHDDEKQNFTIIG